MKKLLIVSMCVAAAVQLANAEEFGEAKTLSTGQEALKVESSIQDEKPKEENNLPAHKALENIANGKYKLGEWDAKNQQIVVKAFTTFTLSSNAFDDSYLNLRHNAMLKLLLQAKGEIIEALAGEISAERVRDSDPEVGEDIALAKNDITR